MELMDKLGEDDVHRQIMSHVQRVMCTSDVACCYLVGESDQVYMCNSYNEWPAITMLLQGVSRIARKRFQSVMLLHTGASEPTMMCQGMIDYLCSWDEFNINCVQVGIWNVDWSLDVEELEYIEIDPGLVLERSALINYSTIQQTAFPAPQGLNLIGGQVSHIHRLYMALAFRTAGVRGFYLGTEVWQHHWESMIYQHGHSIGAVLVNSAGRVLVKSINTKAANVTFHAEVNLIQAFVNKYGREVCAAEYLIYTTLKPCKMCAAMIAHVLPNCKVIYAQDDFGKHAQNTDSPLHGIIALDTIAKPLRLYESGGEGGALRHGNIAQALNALRNGQSLTQTLDTSYAGRQMLQASLTLERKFNKYKNTQPSQQQHEHVKNVASYLNSLLDPV